MGGLITGVYCGVGIILSLKGEREDDVDFRIPSDTFMIWRCY